MSNFAASKSVILKDVRLDFFDIYTPGKPMNPGGKAKYKVKAIFEKDSDAAKVAKAAMLEAATALWGANAQNVIKAMTANSKALRDGDSNLDDKGGVRKEYEDRYFISASNESKPQVVGPVRVDRDGGKAFIDVSQDGRGFVHGVELSPPPYKLTAPYRGCYVNVKVQFVAGKTFKAASGETLPNQVYAKLEAVQFLREGEAFGAGPTSAEGFDDEVLEAGAIDLDDPFA